MKIERNDVVGGVTTFLTCAYIVVVNPAIIATPGTGMSFSGVLTATVLLCVLMTLFMGLYADLPFAVAPGLGVNAFFTYTVVLGKGVPWQQALGAVFWAGVLFVVCSITPVREKIVKAIPKELRLSAAVGIGLFLCFIGLKNMGLIISNPETFVQKGPFGFESLISILGFVVMVYFFHKKNPFSFLIGIVLIFVVALLAGKVAWPTSIFSSPDFESVFFKLDIWGALKWSLLPTIVSILFTDLFDSISTFVGVSESSGLTDQDGHPKNLKQGLIVDAFATLTAGLFGTSSGTAYIESAAGIEAGAKTGKASVVTALCFLPCFFLAPLAGMVPAYATGPVLLLVGFLMFRCAQKISFEKIEVAMPAFLSIIMIPLTFSITQGILWGIVSHVVIYICVGKWRMLNPVMVILSFISVGLMILEQTSFQV